MAEYLKPYRDALHKYGTGQGITLWRDSPTQTVRFEVLIEMLRSSELRERGDLHLLDAGCSRGDMAAWMIKQGVPFGRYTGVDGVEEVVAFAQQRGLERCGFLAGDFVTHPELLATGEPDVIVMSGTLNSMDDALARQVLEAAWAAGPQALIFNFLSDANDLPATEPDDPANRLNTRALVDWALSKTPRIQFRQDYFFDNGHDATIGMFR